MTSRLHYANVGIEDEKLGYITSCVWFIIVNYEKPSCFLIQKYGERERERGRRVSLIEGERNGTLSAVIETYRSKTVFLYRVSDPLSSTV